MQPNAQNSFIPGIPHMNVEDFHTTYWFNSLQMVEVINPLSYDWPFMVEGRHFIIKSGAKERFPGIIANIYLDQVSKILAQDDDKLAYMADPNLKKIYYDKLIIHVEDLMSQVQQVPAYMRDVNPATIAQPPSEKAPWDTSLGERASDLPLPPPPTPEYLQPAPPVAVPEPAKEPEETTKSFELGEDKYKFVTRKDGHKMYYKNGALTNVAEYNRAASLL